MRSNLSLLIIIVLPIVVGKADCAEMMPHPARFLGIKGDGMAAHFTVAHGARASIARRCPCPLCEGETQRIT